MVSRAESGEVATASGVVLVVELGFAMGGLVRFALEMMGLLGGRRLRKVGGVVVVVVVEGRRGVVMVLFVVLVVLGLFFYFSGSFGFGI
jgi:hypothetical protein